MSTDIHFLLSDPRASRHVRLFVPWYSGKYHRPSLLDKIKASWKAIWYPLNWTLRYHRWSHSNWRCWCFKGYAMDIHVSLAGFGFIAWISRYTGPLPCPCDDAMHEMHHDPESVLYDPESCDDENCSLARASLKGEPKQ